MATLSQVETGLFTLVSDALATVGYLTDIGVGWAPINVLQNVSRGPPAIVSIYNRRIGRNATRWSPYSFNFTATPVAITSAVSSRVLSVGHPVTITVTGTPNPGDAVSAVIFAPTLTINPTNVSYGQTLGQVSSTGFGWSAADLVDDLANKIVEDPVLNKLVRANGNGDGSLTLTAKVNQGPFKVASYVGNGGVAQREVGRREESFQIVCWCQTTEVRDLIADPIDAMLALAEINYGPTLIDGTAVRLLNLNNYNVEDATLSDVYRRDFLLQVEWPITILDQLFAILVPSLAQQSTLPAA